MMQNRAKAQFSFRPLRTDPDTKPKLSEALLMVKSRFLALSEVLRRLDGWCFQQIMALESNGKNLMRMDCELKTTVTSHR